MPNNAMRLMELVNGGGVNSISNAYPVKGGMVVTLSHKATTDEASCIFIPDDKIVFWHDDERRSGAWGDEKLDEIVEAICHA